MTIRAVILWLHAGCGVVWVAASATFILGSAGLAGDANEAYAFAVRVVPQLNRLCIPLALAIPVTGIGNLFFAAKAHGAVLPAEFIGIVAAKVGLLALMGFASFRVNNSMLLDNSEPSTSRLCTVSDIHRIIRWYWLIVGPGIVALGLGLWLSGS
jgi:hypothetical protein